MSRVTLRGSDNDSYQPQLVVTTPSGLHGLVYLPNGQVVTGGNDGTARIWNLGNGEQRGTSMQHDRSVHDLIATSDGKKIISCDDTGNVKVWDVDSQLLVKKWTLLEWFPKVAISPDDRSMAVGNKCVSIHATKAGWEVRQTIEIGVAVFCMTFSPDGNNLACGTDHDIRVYDTNTGTLVLGPLAGHSRRVRSVLWSRRGNTSRLVSGSFDRTIRCWNLNTGEQIGRPWTGHTKQISSLSLSPDGSVLASTSLDQTIRFWDAAIGVQVGQPIQHNGSVGAVRFSQSGGFVTSVTYNGEIYLWRTPLFTHTINKQMHGNSCPISVPFTNTSPELKAVQLDRARVLLDANTLPPPDLTPYILRNTDQYVNGGGFGDVYKCWYQADGLRKQVAVKALRFKLAKDKESSDRTYKMFRRELGIWRRLDHENIVPFLGIAYGFGMEDAVSLVSLWMSNESIHNFLEKYNNELEVGHRLQFLLGIAKGLQYLHSFPIIHGDLNCNNVLLDKDYTPRLADFGYASTVGNIPEALGYLQRSTARPGALRWIAPEQLDSDEAPNWTTRSDIYSFGCIALQVLSGKQPWSELWHDIAIVSRLAKGQKPARPDAETLFDSHWRLINECWSEMEERPAAEAVTRSVHQFLVNSHPSQSIYDLVLSSSFIQNLSLEDQSISPAWRVD